jgi:hypothetical protein
VAAWLIVVLMMHQNHAGGERDFSLGILPTILQLFIPNHL